MLDKTANGADLKTNKKAKLLMWRHEEDSNIQWYMCKQAPPTHPLQF